MARSSASGTPIKSGADGMFYYAPGGPGAKLVEPRRIERRSNTTVVTSTTSVSSLLSFPTPAKLATPVAEHHCWFSGASA